MKSTILCILITLVSAQSYAQKGKLTSKDRKFAIKYLEAVTSSLLTTLADIPEEKWFTKSADGGWSPAECVEHVILADYSIFKRVRGEILQTEPDINKMKEVEDKTALILTKIPDRSFKATTITPLEPTGKWQTKSEAIKTFQESRRDVINWLSNTKDKLRMHFTEAPAGLGTVDAYQMFLIMGAHGERHRKQIVSIINNTSGS